MRSFKLTNRRKNKTETSRRSLRFFVPDVFRTPIRRIFTAPKPISGAATDPTKNGSAPKRAEPVPAFSRWLSDTIAAATGAAMPKKNIITNRVNSTAQMPKSAQIKNAPAIIAKKTRKLQHRILVGGNNDK